ncbi:hypothetical protein LDENG_00155240 [Lucifuga dentata]|nr:hypothetical protein LDENG_00155240 [Lucifuga dentata]
MERELRGKKGGEKRTEDTRDEISFPENRTTLKSQFSLQNLDNSSANEKLKFSILKRLPEPMEQRIYQLWDHPVTSASISRDYVRTLLEKHNKNKGLTFTNRDKSGFRLEFLPLTYLTKILSDAEEQALNPFEEQENVDARFVEETALKQTLILLGFEEK